jgi:hypothetical protein
MSCFFFSFTCKVFCFFFSIRSNFFCLTDALLNYAFSFEFGIVKNFAGFLFYFTADLI